jgi:Holliday junction resolvasome RuvABC endonuclease subunit
MRILGIDTGIVKLGWCALSGDELLECGMWSPPSDIDAANAQTIDKLRKQYPETVDTIKKYRITHLAVEQVPMQQFQGRDKVVAIENMMRCIAIQYDLFYKEITPRVVKQRATGDSKASKADMKAQAIKDFPVVAEMGKLSFDTYDAINIANVCSKQTEGWWLPLSLTGNGRVM